MPTFLPFLPLFGLLSLPLRVITSYSCRVTESHSQRAEKPQNALGTQLPSPWLRKEDWGVLTDPLTYMMSKVSRLARPSSTGAGSKLPSPRKECPGTAGVASRVRVLSVGEKLMRAGNDNVPNRPKQATGSTVRDKVQTETQTETPTPDQGPGEKDQTMEVVSPKSRISPPKASSQQQNSVNSKYKQTKSKNKKPHMESEK